MEWEVLYHYTSLDAFVNIIKGKEFRLFDITKSNDPLEGTYMIQALEESYVRLYRSEKITRDEYLLAYRSFLEFSEDVYSHNRLKDFYAAASFCIPHHELTMLRSYADNGKGVALGVPIKILEGLSSKLPGVQFKKVEYLSPKGIAEYADKFWIEHIRKHKNIIKNINEETLSPFAEEIKACYEAGYFLKHDVNKDEEEYRLLYHYDDLFYSYLPGLGEDVPKEIDFVSGNSILKAYYKIPVGTEEDGLFYFSDILSGPLCGASSNEMCAFLRRYGISHCNVSEISWVQMR